MGQPGVARRGRRRITAWTSTVATLASAVTAGLVGAAASAVVAPAVAHAFEGSCGQKGMACILAEDAVNAAAVWEAGTTNTRVAVVLSEVSDKARTFQLTIGQADGLGGRVLRGHQLDTKTELSSTAPVIVTIAAGQTSAAASLKLIDDSAVEPDEWFDIALTEISPTAIDHGHFAVRVVDDDVDPVAVTVSDKTGQIVEGGAPFELGVMFNGDIADVADITLVAEQTPAGAKRTIAVDPPVLRLAKGETGGVALSALADGSQEGPTTVVLKAYAQAVDPLGGDPVPADTVILGVARPATAQSPAQTARDPLPHVAIQATASADESDGHVTLTVTRSVNLDGVLTIPLAFIDGTAQLGLDFPHPNDDVLTAVALASGAAASTFDVSFSDDPAFEGDETFQVQLGTVAGVTYGNRTATVTITDTADAPVVRFVPGDTVQTGHTGDDVQMHLLVDDAPAIPITYDVYTDEFEADADFGYVEFDQPVTIAAGAHTSNSFFIPLDPVSDPGSGITRRIQVFAADAGGNVVAGNFIAIADPFEPFARFARPEGAPPGPHRVTLTEGTAGPITHQLVVAKPEFLVGAPYQVDVELHPLSTDPELAARVFADVTVSPTTFMLQPGQTSTTLTVTIAGNDIDQPDLPFAVVLTNPRHFDNWGEPDDLAELTILDDDAPSEENAADTVRNGILDWFQDLLGGWAQWFDLGEIDWPAIGWPEFALPVLPDPADYFDLDDLFAGLEPPGFDVDADDLDDAVQDFEDAGCPVDFVLGGFGGKPEPPAAGDLIQVHCVRTLEQIAQASGYAGPDVALTNDVLQDIAEELGLDATIDWTADVELHVIAGVDGTGLYLLGATGVRAHVTGNGVVSGAGTVLGVQDAQLLGTGEGDLTVVVPLSADTDERIRPEQLGAIVPGGLRPQIEGSAELILAAGLEDTDVDWTGRWEIAPHPTTGAPVVGQDHDLTITQALPGLAVGDQNVPAVLTLHGATGTCNGAPGWLLDGELVAAGGDDLTFDGFTVTELAAEGCLADGAYEIDVTAALVVGAGSEAGGIDLHLHLDEAGWSGTGSADLATFTVGSVTVADPTLTVHVAAEGEALGMTVAVAAATATFADGVGQPLGTLTGVTGSLQGTEQLTLHADRFTASIGNGALEFDLAGVDLAVPGIGGVVFGTAAATATAPGLGDLTVTISDLAIHDDGRFSTSSVEVDAPSGILRTIGLGGLVPVDVTGLQLEFPDLTDLSSFQVGIEGTVDLSGFAGLPFTPVVQLGGAVITPSSPLDARRISFSAFVESVDPLVIAPRDLGPITLGLHDLAVGALTFSAEVSAEGYVGGVLQPGFDGFARVEGGLYTGIEGSLEADISGSFEPGPAGPEVVASAVIGFDAAQAGGVQIEDLQATLGLRLGVGADGLPFLVADLTEVSVGSVFVPFGEFADLVLTDAVLDLTPDDGAVFTIGGSLDDPASGASLQFKDAFALLAGWGGRVGGVSIGTDFQPRLTAGFFVDVTVPGDETFGLPDFLPVYVDEVGFALPEGLEPGDPLTDLLANLVISVSGGLEGTTGFPVDAAFEDLSVDIGKLLDYEPLECGFDPGCFPVDLAGFRLAIDPELDLGGAAVSGELTFGTVIAAGPGGERDVLYGRIRGNLRTPAFEAGADVVISEYGPVLLRVTAPAAVPLGPTGLILQSVTGAAAFGDVSIPVPAPGQPEQLLDPGSLADLPTDGDITAATIAARIAPSVAAGEPTWNDGFALALKGNLTHVAAAGMLGGKVVAGINIRPGAGPQLFLVGSIEAFGVPLTDPSLVTGEDFEISGEVALAGMLIDFTNPLEPSFNLAFQAPAPGSPFELLVPTQATVSAQLLTTGIVPGVVAGLRAGLDTLGAGTFDGVAGQLDGDRANPLTRLVLDADADGSVSPAEAAVTITGTLLRTRLTAILTGTSGQQAIDDVIAALAAYAATLTPAQGTTLIDVFLGTVGAAAEAALRVAGAQFDPSFVFRGALQPAVLGIPLGDPVNQVEFVMTRGSLGIGGTTSIIENTKTGLNLVTGNLAGPAITAASLGLTDRITFSVQLPMPNMTDVLFGDGEVDTFDTADPGQAWSVTLGGSLTQLGLTAEVTGFMTSAGNQGFVDARVEKRWQCYEAGTVPAFCTLPPDPSRVQFSRQADYDTLLAHGGVVLDGRLEVPRLITDPVDVLADATAEPFPGDPLAILGWFDEFGATLGQTETPLRATFLVPGPGGLIDGDQTLAEWAAGISMTGVFEGTRQTPESDPVARLLSIPIGEGRMLATVQGLEITADIPLLGAEGTFAARVDEVPFGGGTVTVPVAKLEVELSTAELDAALADLGLPPVFEVAGVGARAGFRAYTPGFDPVSDDPLQVGGGLAFTALLDAAGFVDNARAEVAVALAGSGSGPDFTATAAVGQLGPFGGVTVTDAELTVTKSGTATSVHVEGSATVFDSHWNVVGDLDADLTGSLTLLGSGGQLPSLSGFQFVSGGLAISLTRTGGTLVGAVGIGGAVALPSWLSGRSATSTVQAAGCLATNGNAELRLALGQIKLSPGGEVVLTGTGATLPGLQNAACTLPPMPAMTANDARLVVRRAGSVTTLAVDGAVKINGSSAPPLFSATGVLASNGTGSIGVSFGTAGLNVGGFKLEGGGTLTLTGGTSFALAVDGTVEIPGIGDLTANGSLDSDGDFDLDIATTNGFRIGGPASPFFAVGAFRLQGVNDVYTFRATGAGFEYRQSNNTVLFSAVIPNFTVSSNGSFSVNTNAFTLGPSTGVHLRVPATTLSANASGLALKLRVPSVELHIPDIADGTTGKPRITATRALDIDTTNFRYVLIDSRQLDLGLMRLTGKLVFERVNGGPFQLAIEGPNASTPANIDLGDLGRIDLPTFRFATNGDFDVSATTTQLGLANPRFLITGASLRFRNTGNATATTGDDLLELQVNGGDLALPSLPDPIALPNLSLRVATSFTRDITVPAIDLGPAFRTNQSATFTLTVERSRVRIELKNVGNNDPTMTALAGSADMKLTSFLIDSNGAFEGSVTGKLQVFGHRLAQGTFNVRLANGVFELALPSPGLNVNFGFGTVKVAGFARSNGQFSFTGTMSTSGSVPGVVSWNGSATITADNTKLAGSFSGHVNLVGLLSGSASGSADSTGRVTGQLRVDLDDDGDTNGVPGVCAFGICSPRIPERLDFAFKIGGNLSADTTKPTMPQPPNVSVTTSATGATVPAYFDHPVANDNRDGQIIATCSPGSGTQFTVNATATVTCTARDAAGNSVARSFTVTVTRTTTTILMSGSTMAADVGGFAAGANTTAGFFSEPQAVATAIADPGGVAHYLFEVPEGLEAGQHHIVAFGAGKDGELHQWVIPVVVDEAGQVASVEANVVPLEALPDGASRFVPLAPARLFDTRTAETAAPGPKGAVGPEASIDVQVAGALGIPADAVAVVMNLTVTSTAGPGFVSAYPTGSPRPTASAVNIGVAGQTRPNLVTVPIGDGGRVTLYSHGTVDLIGDVAGYYAAAGGPVAAGRFVALSPERLFDTRESETGSPGPKGKLGAGGSAVVQVLGAGSVPATGVAAVVVNLTATDADGPGFVTAYPTSGGLPLASNVNLSAPGDTAPNLAIVPVGEGGTITVYSSHGAHVLADVTGYITSDAAGLDTAGLFVPLAPERAFDTRDGEPAPGPKGFVPAGGQIDVAVAGVGSVPVAAAGVVLNVTGVDSAAGFLTAWPAGPDRPNASTLNFVATPLDTRANGAMLPLGEGGRISLYTLNGSHVLADVAGYFLG